MASLEDSRNHSGLFSTGRVANTVVGRRNVGINFVVLTVLAVSFSLFACLLPELLVDLSVSADIPEVEAASVEGLTVVLTLLSVVYSLGTVLTLTGHGVVLLG
jgi:hypothetical protein